MVKSVWCRQCRVLTELPTKGVGGGAMLTPVFEFESSTTLSRRTLVWPRGLLREQEPNVISASRLPGSNPGGGAPGVCSQARSKAAGSRPAISGVQILPHPLCQTTLTNQPAPHEDTTGVSAPSGASCGTPSNSGETTPSKPQTSRDKGIGDLRQVANLVP